MDLEQRLQTTHRRPHADVGDPGMLHTLQLHLDGEDAVEGGTAPPQGEVGGGKTELSCQLLPFDDPTTERIGSPQQELGLIQIGLAQPFADAAAADALLQRHHGVGVGNGETKAFPRDTECVVVALALMAKAEIIADDQMAHANALDQQPVDELIHRHAAEVTVEAQAEHPIDPLLSQQCHLVGKGGQSRRRLIPGKELLWLRLKGDHHRRQVQLGRAQSQSVQDLLMAAVHTIEIADGGHAAAMPWPQVVHSANQLHDASRTLAAGLS